ncbi:MAG: energy-coupling factor ABC transporter permease, partial [Pseudomonadota bacterium]
YAGFLTMASILLIQALFFGDGGLLAYGCNVLNLGFYTCFIAYPFIYKRMTSRNTNTGRIFGASMLAAVLGLQLGALSVVLETVLSGKTELPFGVFLMFMQPIHLAIGVVEGLATAAVVVFVWRARPELLEKTAGGKAIGELPVKNVMAALLALTIVVGGIFSWFASSDPDGLEWSIERTASKAELEASDNIHGMLAAIQSKIEILPEYSFADNAEGEAEEVWPAVSTGTSVSGIVGGVLTLALAAFSGLLIGLCKKYKKRT